MTDMLAQDDKQGLLLQVDALMDGGRLAEARAVYIQITQLDPADVESWLMRTAIEAELGLLVDALAGCQRVHELDTGNAEAYSMRGRLLASQGRMDEAQAALVQALELDPDDGDAWNTLAGIHLRQAKFAEAAQDAEKAIRLLPQSVEALVNRGNALSGLGRFEDALSACARAVTLDGRNGLAWGSLALVRERMENWAEARNAYKRMLECLPNNLGGMLGLGRAHCALGEFESAGQVLSQALTRYPKEAEVHRGLGVLQLEKGNEQLAEHHLREAITLNESGVAARVDLGNLLQKQQRYQEAENCYAQALAVAGPHPDVYFNLGVCEQRQGRLEAALDNFDRAIKLRPDFVEAHWYKSFICLLQGDYEHGWEEYEWRLKQKQNVIRPFDKPVWDGSSLLGRTILVHDEQGYGDTFQFVRYLPLVKALGARVVFECHAKLAPVLSGARGYDELVEREVVTRVPSADFDTHIPLLSLPRIFRTRRDDVPAALPYIDADPARVARWRDRLAEDGAAFKIGIAWAGSANHTNELNRSCPLNAFEPISVLPGVRVYSLQKGPGSEQADDLPLGMRLVRVDKELDMDARFVDTAALMVNLDLIITIDTSVAHLAGALGCTVWTLLCASPDWRWGQGGERTPWYPQMRLFRQHKPGDWAEVMTRVCEALQMFNRKPCCGPQVEQ